LLGLGSGEVSSLPAGGVHWWQIYRSCGRRSADGTASGTMAKKMFTGLTECSQRPYRGKNLVRRWRNSQSLSLMQWQIESPRLGRLEAYDFLQHGTGSFSHEDLHCRTGPVPS